MPRRRKSKMNSSSDEEEKNEKISPKKKRTRIRKPLSSSSSSEEEQVEKISPKRKRIIQTDSSDDSPDYDGEKTEEIQKRVKPEPVTPLIQLDSSEESDDNNNGIGPATPTGSDESRDESDESSYTDLSFVDNDENDDEAMESDESFQPPDPGLYMTQTDKRPKKKPKKTKKRSESNSEEDDQEYLFSSENVQEVSIHKIMMDKFKDNFNTNPKRIIDHIICTYNCPKGKTPLKSPYKEHHVKIHPQLKNKDSELFLGDEFEIKIFVQKVTKSSSILKSYGVEEDESNAIHSLIFHYREDEIFVLTTNQAWNVVQWCSDFAFPGKIAARILSEKGELDSTQKGLVGTDLVSKKTHKQEQESNPYELLTFCTRFVAEIRENASLLRLQCFQKQTQPQQKAPEAESILQSDDDLEEEKTTTRFESLHRPIKKVRVTVSLAAVRINHRFQPSDFLGILSYFSTISKGEETKDLDGKKEKDSSAHTKYLTQVQTEHCKGLSMELSKLLHDALADDRKLHAISNYEISHKHFEDYYNGQNYTLFYGNDQVKLWPDRPPTCRDVILALRGTNLGNLGVNDGEETFFKRLGKVQLGYSVRGKNIVKKPEKILNFVEGMTYRSSDNCVYWHIQAQWYFVSEVYILLVHNQFLNILKTSLLTEVGHPAKLKNMWPSLEQQRDSRQEVIAQTYLECYNRHNNFYYSDQGLFDLIKLTVEKLRNKNNYKLYIYYVMPALDFETASKGVQITNSLLKLRKASVGNEGSRNSVGGTDISLKKLRGIFQDLINTKPTFKKACKTYGQFEKLISEAEICLAVGPYYDKYKISDTDNEEETYRTLEEELKIPLKISADEIQEILARQMDLDRVGQPSELTRLAAKMNKPLRIDDCHGLAKSVKKLLQSQGYLDTMGSITGKLLGITRYTFVLVDFPTSLNSFVYDNIIKKFQPQCSTFFAKLELIRMQQEVQKLGLKKFHIVEIPTTD